MFFCVYEWKRAFAIYNLSVLPLRTVKETEDKKKKSKQRAERQKEEKQPFVNSWESKIC